METTFRWRSWLGASVIVFLIFGVINVGLAIAVPATLHLNGSFPGVVFGAGDAQLLGFSFAGLRQRPVAWPPLKWDAHSSLGAANPFGSVCEPSRRRLTSYWKCCWTGKVTWQR